jgi:hypothetical protein
VTDYQFHVEVQGGNLIVMTDRFCAVYSKPTDQPQLIMRLRRKSDDYELLAKAWHAANRKAHELGWITDSELAMR